MKKSKIQKNKILTIVLLLICFCLLVSNITLAWFTSRDELSDSLEFGTIEIDATTDDLIAFTATRTSGKLMPGDTIKIKFNVENKGEAAYYLIAVTLGGVSTNSGFENIVGIYAGDIQTDANSDNVPDNKVATKVTEITESTTKKVGSLKAFGETGATISNEKTFVIDAETTENEFQSKEISITVSVYAIQQANITESNAFDKLVELAKPSELVVVNNIQYFYIKETDSYSVGYNPTCDFENEVYGDFLTGVYVPEGKTYNDPEIIANIEKGLESTIYGRPVTTIAPLAFVPENEMNTGTFENTLPITKITFPSSLTSIGELAFTGTLISEVNLPNTIQSIGGMAFGFCQQIKKVDLPSSLQTLGAYAFGFCQSLQKVTISSSNIADGFGPFYGTSLDALCFNVDYEGELFYLRWIGTDGMDSTLLNTIYIKQGLTFGENSAFKGWENEAYTETTLDGVIYNKYTL